VVNRRAALAGFACAFLLGAGGRAAADTSNLSVEGAAVHLELTGSEFAGGAAPIIEWVRRSASIVSHYYGRFPVKELWLRVRSEAGAGVHGGRTFADPDARIEVRVGSNVNAAQLESDWVLVHEMTHLALPDTGEEHAWLSEGIATYVEGVARVQAGNRTELDVWQEELRQMPRGMPQPGDQGLDRTHTWGRTYWGGAMFCLLADVDIRERTHLKFGLQDALRAVLRSSGGLAANWPIARVLRTGDAAVGTNSLEELYERTKATPFAPDLPGLWQRLGVESDGASVRLTDDAPLSAVRHAIMRPPAP
jgi:hypothetical protein